MGEDQTHTIKFFTQVDFTDVPIGQEAFQYHRIQVRDKS